MPVGYSVSLATHQRSSASDFVSPNWRPTHVENVTGKAYRLLIRSSFAAIADTFCGHCQQSVGNTTA